MVFDPALLEILHEVTAENRLRADGSTQQARPVVLGVVLQEAEVNRPGPRLQ